MASVDYDYVIIGSGAGGSAAAYYLAQTGARVLLLERGPALARDAATLDVRRVMRDKAYHERENWLDRFGNLVSPEERSNLGGKTKWYGAALLRFAPEEFSADRAHSCKPWPIDYSTLAPFYDAAEQLLGVRHFPIERDLAGVAAKLTSRGWQAKPLPMGLAPEILDNALEARHFDGFASPAGLKRDAQTAFLARVIDHPNLDVLTDTAVTALVPDAVQPLRVAGVQTADGRVFRARHVLLAAGALHSPRLLQRYVEQSGLAGRLPCADRIGRAYKFHVLTAVVGFALHRRSDVLRKTTLFLNDRFPHSSVQPLGWLDGELLAAAAPVALPRVFADPLGARAYGFFLQTEDGSHPDNRVVAGADGSPSYIDYDLARLPAARDEHARLVAAFRRDLRACGYWPFSQSIGIAGSAHACGTLAAGFDSNDSVVDADGRVHGLANLYVVDGSALPRSSRANPALTIFAWSLRVASRLAGRAQKVPAERDAIAVS